MKRATVSYGGCCDAAKITLDVSDDQLALLRKLEGACNESGEYLCARMAVEEQS